MIVAELNKSVSEAIKTTEKIIQLMIFRRKLNENYEGNQQRLKQPNKEISEKTSEITIPSGSQK